MFRGLIKESKKLKEHIGGGGEPAQTNSRSMLKILGIWTKTETSVLDARRLSWPRFRLPPVAARRDQMMWACWRLTVLAALIPSSAFAQRRIAVEQGNPQILHRHILPPSRHVNVSAEGPSVVAKREPKTRERSSKAISLVSPAVDANFLPRRT